MTDADWLRHFECDDKLNIYMIDRLTAIAAKLDRLEAPDGLTQELVEALTEIDEQLRTTHPSRLAILKEIARITNAALAKVRAPDGEDAVGANGQAVKLLTINGRVVEVDTEIAPLVAALNAAGMPTRACCSGHGERPASVILADGRELHIARNRDEGRAMEAAAHEMGKGG